jgi:MFS family permease
VPFVGSILIAVGTLAVCLATVVPTAQASEAFQGFGSGFWRVFSPVLTAAFHFGLANSIVFVFLPPFARLAGIPRIGPFYLLYTAMAIAVRFLGGRLADRFGRQQVILPSLVGLAVGVLLFSGLYSTWLMMLIALVNGTSHGFVYPATSALAFDRAPSGARGRALAAYNMAALTGGAVGAIGFGWLAQLVGYRPGFVVAGVTLAVGALLFWRRK